MADDAEMRVAIVDCGSSKVPDIGHAISLAGATANVIAPSELRTLSSDRPAAIIISGNPALIKDTGTKFLADFDVLHELSIPTLGICFGHQVIGLLFGADVTVGKEDRELRRMEFLGDSRLFDEISDKEVFQEDHIEEVTVPENFVHLATSSHCHNEAMMHRELPLYGVQFHPESSGRAGERLIKNFVSLAREKTIAG